MAFEPKDNSGSLFRNDKKEKDTHPNMKGSARIGGVDFWVSAWTKTGQSGDKFQSLAFTRKDAQQAAPRDYDARKDSPQRPLAEDIDDTIPF